MRSKLIPNGKIRPGSFYFVYVGILILIASMIFSYFYQMYFNNMVEFRLEQLESQNIACEVETEPYTEFNQEVALCYPLADYERAMVEKVVMAEAGNQSLLGQMAVAQVVLCRAVLWDMSIEEVVNQPYQFAIYNGEPTEKCRLAVSNVFDLGEKPISQNVTHFYSGNYEPYWVANKESRGQIGGHLFYR